MNDIYLMYIVRQEAERQRQRAEVVGRMHEGLDSLPVESGRARIVARYNALRRAASPQRSRVDQTLVETCDADAA